MPGVSAFENQKATELVFKLCKWIGSETPEHRMGRHYHIHFRLETARARFEEIVGSFIRENSDVDIRTLSTIVGRAFFNVAALPFFPNDFGDADIHREWRLIEDGIPWRQNPLIIRHITNIARSSDIEQLRTQILSDDFYSDFTSAFNQRLEQSIWQLPDFSRMPKIIQLRNSTPEVFIMRRPLLQYCKGDDHQKDLATLPYRMRGLYVWESIKGALEYLGGHVIVMDEPAKGREAFVTDPATILYDGRLIIPTFPQEGVGPAVDRSADNAEKDVLVNKLLQLMNVTPVRFDERLDGANVLQIGPENKKVTLVGGWGDELEQSVRFFKTLYPDAVIPIELDPFDRERFFHLDFAVNKLPNERAVMHPQLLVWGREKQRLIQAATGREPLIVDDETVMGYGLNLRPVKSNLLMPACSDAMRDKLRGEGCKVYTPEDFDMPPGTFYSGLAGVGCHTQPLPFKMLNLEVQRDIMSKIRD